MTTLMSSNAQTGTVYIQGKAINAPTGLDFIPEGHNAFTCTQIARPAIKVQTRAKPRKKLTKAQKAAQALETLEERKARWEAEILTVSKYSDVGRNFPAQADRTNQITGKRITARHQ
jgi:hypothetical protein